jgi:hypothetical protein
MLLGGRRTQQSTINGRGEGDGQPVQERQGSGRQRLALEGTAACSKSVNDSTLAGADKCGWWMTQQQQSSKSVNDSTLAGADKCGWWMTQQQQTTQQPTIIGSIKSGYVAYSCFQESFFLTPKTRSCQDS